MAEPLALTRTPADVDLQAGIPLAQTLRSLTGSDIMDIFCKDELALQMGGKATVGRGQVRTVFTEGSV